MRNISFLFALLCLVTSKGFCANQNRLLPRYKNVETHSANKIYGEAVAEVKTEKEDDTEDYPCPSADDIAPCICYELNSRLTLDCTNAVNESQIAEVFEKDFPVKSFFQFEILCTHSLVNLDFSTNGVTFGAFAIKGELVLCTSTIESISANVFMDSANTVTTIAIQNTMLTTEGFPFEALPNYTILNDLNIWESQMTELPPIVSDSLESIFIVQSNITALEPGN